MAALMNLILTLALAFVLPVVLRAADAAATPAAQPVAASAPSEAAPAVFNARRVGAQPAIRWQASHTARVVGVAERCQALRIDAPDGQERRVLVLTSM
ncbi:MAG: hypothetical protein IBJ10_06450 [Phycisphaerales bacterium]|nr:hypothetical protein [Phycisphaerales bacterium]